MEIRFLDKKTINSSVPEKLISTFPDRWELIWSRRRSLDRGLVSKRNNRISRLLNVWSTKIMIQIEQIYVVFSTMMIVGYYWFDYHPYWSRSFEFEWITNSEVECIVRRVGMFAEESSFHSWWMYFLENRLKLDRRIVFFHTSGITNFSDWSSMKIWTVSLLFLDLGELVRAGGRIGSSENDQFTREIWTMNSTLLFPFFY